MSFLVDTDVLSEPTKHHPEAKVEAWLETHQAVLYTSAITIGELMARDSLAARRHPSRAAGTLARKSLGDDEWTDFGL